MTSIKTRVVTVSDAIFFIVFTCFCHKISPLYFFIDLFYCIFMENKENSPTSRSIPKPFAICRVSFIFIQTPKAASSRFCY